MRAVLPRRLYMGAFQFSQGTWNDAAQLAAFPGIDRGGPDTASKASQDTLAVALYAADGSAALVRPLHRFPDRGATAEHRRTRQGSAWPLSWAILLSPAVKRISRGGAPP